MKARARAVKDIARYVPSSYLSQGIDMVTSVLVRRFLGPAMMGVWSFCNVLLSYAKYAALGAGDVAIKEIPFHLAKGDEETANSIQNVVFSFTTMTSMLMGLAVFIYTQLFRAKLSQELYWGFLTVAVVVVLQRLQNLLIGFLRAHKDFKRISKQVIWSSAVNCFLVLVLARQFRLYGYFMAVIGSLLFNIAYVQWTRRFPIRFSLNSTRIKPILGLGLPLLISGILNMTFQSADKVVITKFLGFKKLGYYELAQMAHTYLYGLPNLIAIVLFPYFQEKFGVAGSDKGMTGYVLTPITILAGLLPVPIGIAWLVAPLFAHWFLPAFGTGVTALQILVLGTFFLSLCWQLQHFLITTNKFGWLLTIGASMVACIFSINLGFVKLGWGLNGVAGATALSYFIYFIFLFTVVGRFLDPKVAWVRLQKILLFFSYYSLLLVALFHWVVIPSSEVLQTFCRVLIYLVAISPVVLSVGRETGFLKDLSSLWKTWRNVPIPVELVVEKEIVGG